MTGRARVWLAAAHALLGALLMVGLDVAADGALLDQPRTLVQMTASATAGAGAAGAVCAPLYGRPGGRGWAIAAAGLCAATALGASLGGTLFLPGAGTVFAPAVVAVMMWHAPVLVLLWLAGLAAIHRLAAALRAAPEATA